MEGIRAARGAPKKNGEVKESEKGGASSEKEKLAREGNLGRHFTLLLGANRKSGVFVA